MTKTMTIYLKKMFIRIRQESIKRKKFDSLLGIINHNVYFKVFRVHVHNKPSNPFLSYFYNTITVLCIPTAIYPTVFSEI